jgi:hypothetical protein
MERDDTMKWLAIMFVGIAIAGALGSAFEKHLRRQDAAEAMKHGYVQDKDGHWVKEAK